MNEEFDKWWDDTDEYMFQNHTKPEFKDAFLAGAAAMKERCAEVAESDDTCECGCSSDYECNHCAIKNNIAESIRGQR